MDGLIFVGCRKEKTARQKFIGMHCVASMYFYVTSFYDENVWLSRGCVCLCARVSWLQSNNIKNKSTGIMLGITFHEACARPLTIICRICDIAARSHTRVWPLLLLMTLNRKEDVMGYT